MTENENSLKMHFQEVEENNIKNEDVLMKNKNEKSEEKIHYGTPMIVWNAPEFIEHNRGTGWYMVMGILAVSLIIYGIVTNSLAFSILIILLAGVIFLTNKHKPKIVKIIITDAGIKFGDKFYPYEEIRAFWILFDPPHVKTLNLRVTKGVSKEIAIQLENQNPSEIRNYLGTEIPEWKNRTETLAEILIRLLKL